MPISTGTESNAMAEAVEEVVLEEEKAAVDEVVVGSIELAKKAWR